MNPHTIFNLQHFVYPADVPTPPQNVSVSDIFSTSCVLQWNEPEDDGGTPLTHYIIERMDVNQKDKWTEIGEVIADTTTYKSEDLQENKRYKFRIRALNKIGKSDPAQLADTVLAKDPWDLPGPPLDIEILDWDRCFVDLTWKPPLSDGGAEITNYVVECKEKFSTQWVKCHMTDSSRCEAKVEDIIVEGKTYEFRTRAINKGGEGEASIPTKPVVVKSRFVKPFIIGDTMTDIVVKRGQHLSWDLKYGGEPDPTVKWMFNDAEIEANDR